MADKSTAESGGGSGGSELSPAESIPKISSIDGRELGFVPPVDDDPVEGDDLAGDDWTEEEVEGVGTAGRGGVGLPPVGTWGSETWASVTLASVLVAASLTPTIATAISQAQRPKHDWPRT